jgi:hypothetical protein
VKIARAATGRPAVIAFDQAFPRPDAARDVADREGESVQEDFGPTRRDLPRTVLLSVPWHRFASGNAGVDRGECRSG